MEKSKITKSLAVFASVLLIIIIGVASFAYFGTFNVNLVNNVAVNINSSSPGNATFTSNATQLNLQVPAANMSYTAANNTVAAKEDTAFLDVTLTGSQNLLTTCTYDIVYEYDAGSNIYGQGTTTKTGDATKEITIEVNPGTVDTKKLNDYKKLGINRLSIGLQSTKNDILKKIGRIHTYQEFLEIYKLARETGFKNINIDLMIGIPGQKIGDLKNTLQDIIKLEPEHISVYSLIIEENTPIEKMLENGEIKLPDEDLERNMYWYVKNTLELNGYKHYEISNFAKKGYESKHNMNCWNQMEYVGIGTAAHSYRDITRYSNTEDIKEYIKNVQKGEFEKNRIIHEIQKEEDSKKEFMLLGLRKIDGLKISEFKNKFGDNPIYLYRNELKKLSDEKLIIIQDDNIRLSNKGIDLANLVWEEFV